MTIVSLILNILILSSFQEQIPDMVLPTTQAIGQVQPTTTENPPSTITEPQSCGISFGSEPMDSADGNGVKPANPVSKRNPLVPMGLDVPAPVLPVATPPAPPAVEEVASVTAPPCQSTPNPLSSSTTVVMDTVEDVTKATANVANLFRSVSLDVDPCQEGPSTASATVPDSPTRRLMNKPDGKRSKSCFLNFVTSNKVSGIKI